MSSKKSRPLIVPLFIPHQGCPYRCVFCNQTEISGETDRLDKKRVRDAFDLYLKGKDKSTLPKIRQVAFYGGTFTGLSYARQAHLFSLVLPWLTEKWVNSIRLSTHPQWVDPEQLSFLKRYPVRTIELGVQSTDPDVLRLSGRGGALDNLEETTERIKTNGFELGLQLMLGLPGDDEKRFLSSVDRVIACRPDFVRIYPTMVMKSTALHELYLKNEYRAWTLDDIQSPLKIAIKKFAKEKIKVARLGLCSQASMEENRVAGPYHPALKYWIDSQIALDEVEGALKTIGTGGRNLKIRVPVDKVSIYTGSLKSNLEHIKKNWGFDLVSVKGDEGSSRMSIECS